MSAGFRGWGMFHNLQALRGVACLLVVLYHAADVEAGFGLAFSPLKPLRWFGYAGVDLFFVLSGFIIASTSKSDLGRPSRLPHYAFRRGWRIYPTYWLALGLAVAVYAWSGPRPVFGPDWPAEWRDTLLLLPQADVPRFLPVAWTLSYELMFYVAFAALFLLPRRAAVPALGMWAAAVVAFALPGQPAPNRFVKLAVSPFVLEFLAGCLLAWAPLRLGRATAGGLVLAAAAWCGVGSAVLFRSDPGWLAVTHGPRVAVFGVSAALLVLALVGRERAGGRLGWRWLERVGDASYSIYLTHTTGLVVMLYLTLLVGWSHRRVPHVGWVGVMLAAGVVPGLLLYRFAERPLLRMAKRKPAGADRPAAPARRAA